MALDSTFLWLVTSFCMQKNILYFKSIKMWRWKNTQTIYAKQENVLPGTVEIVHEYKKLPTNWSRERPEFYSDWCTVKMFHCTYNVTAIIKLLNLYSSGILTAIITSVHLHLQFSIWLLRKTHA